MTISEIRRRIQALMRKFARELAIIKLRRVAEAVSQNWDPDDPPEPAAVFQRVVKAGYQLPTFMRLRHYLDETRLRGDVPEPERIVLNLLPWACDHRYRIFLEWDLSPEPTPRPTILRV